MAEGNKSEYKPVTLKKVKFLVGQEVYLLTDPRQLKRVVTAIHIKPGGYEYEVRHSTHETTLHYDIELTEERDEEMFAKYLLDRAEDDDEETD